MDIIQNVALKDYLKELLNHLSISPETPSPLAHSFTLNALKDPVRRSLYEAADALRELLDNSKKGSYAFSLASLQILDAFREQNDLSEEDTVKALCAIFPEFSDRLSSYGQAQTAFEGYQKLFKVSAMGYVINCMLVSRQIGQPENEKGLRFLSDAEYVLTERLGLPLREGIRIAATYSEKVREWLESRNPEDLEAAFLSIKRENEINYKALIAYEGAKNKKSLAQYFNFVADAQKLGIAPDDVEQIMLKNADWVQIKEHIIEGVGEKLKAQYVSFSDNADAPYSHEWFGLVDGIFKEGGYDDAYGDDRLAMGLEAMGFEGGVKEWDALRRKYESGAAFMKTYDDPYFCF